MIPNWQQLQQQIECYIMSQPPANRLGRLRLSAARISYCVARDMLEGQLTLRAMSLVYTTLLSLVPLLAVSFSVLKAFGVHNQIKPLLFEFLGRMGPQGIEVGEKIMGFVDNVKVGVLGSLGIALLFYTVVSLLQKIERSFNYVWRVNEARHLTRRFSDYLSVILVGPVLVFTAVGMTASIKSTALVQSLSSIALIGDTIEIIGQVVPYLLIIIAFSFVYSFMPNTRVRLKSALIGAIVAGVLWETTSWLFASFAVSSANYAAIYSSFAILVLFMLWLYLGWVILLLGVNVSYYHQHPRMLSSAAGCHCLGHQQLERLIIEMMYLIGLHFHQGKPPWTANELARSLGQPTEQISNVLELLAEADLLAATSDKQKHWLPAREMDKIMLVELLQVARGSSKTGVSPDNTVQTASLHVSRAVEQALATSLQGETLKSLVARFADN